MRKVGPGPTERSRGTGEKENKPEKGTSNDKGKREEGTRGEEERKNNSNMETNTEGREGEKKRGK